MVGVYYRPPTQSPELDQEFTRELTEAACSRTFVVMGDFNYPDISWEDHSAKSERAQSFLSCVDDLYLTQEVYGSTRGKALLDLVLATGDDLIGDLVIDGKLGDSDHELITFTIRRKAGMSVSNTEVLDFRKADFDKLKRLVSQALRDHDPREMGVQEEWLLLKEAILNAQAKSIPTQRKGSKKAQQPSWLSRDLADLLQLKRKAYKG